MRFLFALALASCATLALTSATRAQYTPTHLIAPVGGTTGWQCLHERPCTSPSECADAGVTVCSSVTDGVGMSGGICVVDPRSQIYCCRVDAASVDCPVFSGLPTPSCLPVSGLLGAEGICNYGLAYCVGDGAGIATTDLPAVERCYSPPGCTLPPAMMSVPYAYGDCDGDCQANGVDLCPCDPALACGVDAGTPDSGLPDLGAADLGPAVDSGPPADMGSNPLDLGAPDATTPPVDSGSAGMDATTPSPDLGTGVTFRAAGGCSCGVADPAGMPTGALVLSVALLAPWLRRLRRGRR